VPVPSEIFATSRAGRWHALADAPGAWLTVLASLALSLIGVYAINLADAAREVHHGLGPTALKQVLFLGIGVSAAVIIALPHYRILGYLSTPFMIAVVAALVFLLVPAVPTWLVKPRNGARSWIDIGPIDIQPSELAKIAFVLVLARYLRFRENHRQFLGLVPPALIAMVPIALITLQPDLGTALLFVPALFAMLVAAGMKLKHLAVIVVVATLAAPAAYPLLLPHQKARIVGLIRHFQGDTSADRDVNMQGAAAQRIIGSGGVVGPGSERSATLLKYNALPERHNDMIFAVIVGRFGLAGGVAVIACAIAWMLGAFITAAATREPFGRLVAVGLAAFIGARPLSTSA
jgi:cell division protein FtsW (lipid II flippase)